MEIHQFWIERWKSEQRAFAAVLRAVPGDQLDWRPHERSTSAGDLAWQLAEEQKQLSDLIDKGEIVFEQTPRPAGIDEIVAAWTRATEALESRLSRLDAATVAGPAKFLMGGQPVWEDTVGNMMWGYLFDMVHHRGQLSTYLRPMGGKVPSIYGPSADDTGS